MHTRNLTLRGYFRDDGLFDIEGHLTDTKTYKLDMDERGELPPGQPLHEMWMRMTVNEDFLIEACEAVTEHGPFLICPQGAVNFAALAGLSIKPGFLRAAAERIGGIKGCTHLREMLQQMGTVAFQTLYAVRAKRPPSAPDKRPDLLNSCSAYASDGDVVRRRWPQFYTGVKARET
jgi:hypothetical protein